MGWSRFLLAGAALAGALALSSPARAVGATSGVTDEDDTAKKPSPPKPAVTEPPAEAWDIYDVHEKDGKPYFFLGLRYRGNVVPAFLINLFVEEAGTVYTNMIGAVFEYRKDNFSLIPALSYHELGFDDLLFKQKGVNDFVGNYTVVNSGLKVLYGQLDILWSTKLAKNVDFEYGAGFGLGTTFGDLQNNWVQLDPNGPLQSEKGTKYSRCETEKPQGTGCAKVDHQNSKDAKVGGYTESSWFNGGSKPSFFPWISIPQVGVRIKPMKNIVGRIGLGFALTGFWFGLDVMYGLEQKPSP